MTGTTIRMASLDDIPAAAAKIVELAADRRILAFYGPMGAGKTTLIREIARQLGVADTVTSPTFAILNQYEAPGGDAVCHFDFYRLDTPAEALDAGCDEYFDSGSLCLIEWPERIETLLPPDTLRITITPDPRDPERRTIELRVESAGSIPIIARAAGPWPPTPSRGPSESLLSNLAEARRRKAKPIQNN